jgi:hypothetical protein
MLKLRIVCVASVLAAASSVCAAPDQAEFSAYIGKHYGFSPHLLSAKEIDSRSADLDTVWAQVKGRQETYLPLLRCELANPSAPAYFLYDGSKLLLSLSTGQSDRLIAIEAITRCDLRDIQTDDYFFTIHSLAVHGVDVVDAALKILDEPTFRVNVPQHAMVLGQDYALVYLLSQAPADIVVVRLGDRLKVERNVDTQKSLVRCLFYAVRKDALDRLHVFAQTNGLDPEVRKDCLDRISLAEELTKKAGSTSDSYNSLSEKRKKRMESVSDEALIDYDELTLKMYAKLR